jgi:hypothetical protein
LQNQNKDLPLHQRNHNLNYQAMKKYTYALFKNWQRVTIGYICKENLDIYIVVERGSLSHNRPCGFSLYYQGEFHSGWQTLKEAKEMALELN